MSQTNATHAVTVILKGGMGNQMFQYAFGRALEATAKRHGISIDLQFDITSYTDPNTRDTKRPYMLSHVNVHAKTVRREASLVDSLRSVTRRFTQMFGDRNAVAYSPTLLQPPYHSLYEGYWQSEKYFLDISEQLRNEFTLREPFGEAAHSVKESISNEPHAVSIFYRRTDYVGHADLDIGEQEYQQRAIARMRERVPRMKLYVMSDDIEWVRQNANLPPDSILVSSPHIPAHEEMFLMSLCRHHIIPNSTFAWWGAWLNTDPQKIVVAPAQWSTRTNDPRYRDIIPPSWERV